VASNVRVRAPGEELLESGFLRAPTLWFRHSPASLDQTMEIQEIGGDILGAF
jgi:hypothetical protein